ncbi:hypothetical protein [Streptomyces cyaneofuscatus]|uniref:Peptidase C83 domain-containing protein n=1 Tax=Streptomyces cyaneofuscatus TaxID=66883 RepID=A0ABZ1EYW1_9ACTN|nr:hypothetical protein [Streptomyces cyaneofuscatus]WSB09225.1 hypothetical protein OG849_19285 [Streptomyces cyaneofuscatus]WSD47239.1 hypothetical protein OG857_16115 [Streptomyces cyaneofuscatus]
MSSSDQQYPYPYDPQHQPQHPQHPQAPQHWPDGTAGQSALPQEPGGYDQGGTQTWQAPTWDTQYQPTIQRDQGPYPGSADAQGYGQPETYGTGQADPYGTPQPQYQEPQYHQPYQEPQRPQQPYRPAADAAYLPSQGASGSLPLPPEVPAASPAAPVPPAAAPQAPDASGYSAPTTLGNARITDAQRARAEGRSPIIAPGMQPAAITAGLGLLLAGGAAIGSYALLVPLVLLQAVTAAGWFRLNGMWPARQGIALAFLGGLVADAALLAAGREHGPTALLGTLGVWVLLAVVLQLRSPATGEERMYGLMATVVSAALAVLAAGHLAAIPDAVTVGGVAVAAAVLARALPLPGAASVVVALLASAGAGIAVGGFTEYGGQGALLGLAAGVSALIGLRVASYDYPSRFVHMTAGVALPLTAAAPAVYLIGRALA